MKGQIATDNCFVQGKTTSFSIFSKQNLEYLNIFANFFFQGIEPNETMHLPLVLTYGLFMSLFCF